MADHGHHGVKLTFVIQLAGWIITVMLAYGVVNTQLAVQDTQIQQLKADLAEIKADVKSLLRRTP